MGGAEMDGGDTCGVRRVGRLVFTAPVAVATAASPMPAGQFMVKDELARYRSAFYGPIACGNTARSAVLTDRPLTVR